MMCWRGRSHRLAMAGIAIGSLALAIGLQAAIGGTDFMPSTDRSEITIEVDAPAGSNLDYTTQRAEHAVRVARSHPEVVYAYTTVGSAAGAVDKASICVKLVSRHQRKASQDDVGRLIRDELKETSGVTYSVYSSGNGNYKQIQLQLRGPDARSLTALAERVANEVRQVPGAVDVGLSTKGQKPELQVELDRGLAATLGLSAADVAQAIRPAFAGVDAGDWVDPDGETRNVMVRLTDDARSGASSLARLPLIITDSTGAVQPVPSPRIWASPMRRCMAPLSCRCSTTRSFSIHRRKPSPPMSSAPAKKSPAHRSTADRAAPFAMSRSKAVMSSSRPSLATRTDSLSISTRSPTACFSSRSVWRNWDRLWLLTAISFRVGFLQDRRRSRAHFAGPITRP